MKLNEIEQQGAVERYQAVFETLPNGDVSGHHPIGYNPKTKVGRPLMNLHGAPREVLGSFDCEGIRLESLKYGPQRVTGQYNVSTNKLDSLDGIASYIGDGLYLNRNDFSGFHNIHKQIRYLGNLIMAYDNPLENCLLGLVLIPGLLEVCLFDRSSFNYQAEKIIQKYLKSHDINACQDELIDAGFEQFARL